MAIKKDEARAEIRKLWMTWPDRQQQATVAEPLLFYNWLQQNHTWVLSFRSPGDKYQTIAGWLSGWRGGR